MGKHFWLIQRCSFGELKSAVTLYGSVSGSGNLVGFDYMGSAEFQWGAIPRAYRRIMGQYEQYHLHVTDLITPNGVPFCLFCRDERYEQTLKEIKAYLEKPYRTKERTAMDVHFKISRSLEDVVRRVGFRTNFWWCIDIARDGEDVGDWMAFTGAADRQSAFKRCLEKDFTNWWLRKSAEDREAEFHDAY